MEKNMLRSMVFYINSTTSVNDINMISPEQIDYEITQVQENLFSLFEFILHLKKYLQNQIGSCPNILFKLLRRFFKSMYVFTSQYEVDDSKLEKLIKFASSLIIAWKKIVCKLCSQQQEAVCSQFYNVFLNEQIFLYGLEVYNQMLSREMRKINQDELLKRNLKEVRIFVSDRRMQDCWQRINHVISENLEQKTLQTPIKISLLFEFIKLVFTQIQLQTKSNDIKDKFSFLFMLIRKLLRVTKKFENSTFVNKQMVKNIKFIISKTIQLYRLQVFWKPQYQQQRNLMIRAQKAILTENTQQIASQQRICGETLKDASRAYVIKLAHRICQKWELRQRKLTRIQKKLQKQNQTVMFYSIHQYPNLSVSIEKKPTEMYLSSKEQKSIIINLRKKAASMHKFKHQDNQNYFKEQKTSRLNLIEIHKNIENTFSKYFQKVTQISKIKTINDENIAWCKLKSKSNFNGAKEIKRSKSFCIKNSVKPKLIAKDKKDHYEQVTVNDYLKFNAQQVKPLQLKNNVKFTLLDSKGHKRVKLKL